MKKHKIRREPCVIFPHADGRGDEHIIYATAARAQRDAAITHIFGTRYHVHETTARTLWGKLTQAPRTRTPQGSAKGTRAGSMTATVARMRKEERGPSS